jgi:MFS family permease
LNKTAKLMPWLFWALAASFYCYGFFQRVAPSVMVDRLMADFAVSAAVLGNLSAFYFYSYAGLQLPVGILTDRFGARRVLAVAAVLCGVGSYLFATAETLTMAYLGRLLIGAGAGFSWVGTLKVIAEWFPPQRFAMITGMTLMLGMGGAVGGQAPLAKLVEAFGWRETLSAAAVFGIALALAIWLIIRDKPITPPATTATKQKSLMSGLVSAVKRPQTWIIGSFGFFMTAPMLSFAGLWGVPYMSKAYDLSRAESGLAVSTLLIGWAFGAPSAGWVSDHLKRRKLPMLVGGVITLSTICGLIYLPNLPLNAAYGLLFLNGLSSGTMVICFALAREHNELSASGSVLGMINMMVMVSGALFQPLIGWLLDLNWDGITANGSPVYSLEAYRTAFMVLAFCGVGSICAALLVRETHCIQQIED